MSESEDSYVCSISNSPLSFTNEFILNAFLHVTILFIFLNGLFNYILVPIMSNAGKEEIGGQIDSLFEKISSINFNINGGFNCDNTNPLIENNITASCLTNIPSNNVTDSNKSIICSNISNPLYQQICQDNLDNVVSSNTPQTCDNVSSQIATSYCSSLKNQVNNYIESNSTFSNLNIHDADDLYSSIYSIVGPNTNGNNVLDNYIKEYTNPNKLIKEHNQSVINYGINLCIILAIITFILFCVIKYSCSNCINVTKLLLENGITFMFIGAVEFWFFATYAFHTDVSPPSTLAKTAFTTLGSFLVSSSIL